MKKIYFLPIITGILLFACSKDNKSTLNPNTSIVITGKHTSSQAAMKSGTGIWGTDLTDSLAFIVQYAWSFQTGGEKYGLGFDEEMYSGYRDIQNNRFVYHGGYVIINGELGPFATVADKLVFTTGIKPDGSAFHPLDVVTNPDLGAPQDTIAYVPQAVMRAAAIKIKDAYNRGDYDECYRILENDYIFLPITGEKLLKLEAAGIETPSPVAPGL